MILKIKVNLGEVWGMNETFRPDPTGLDQSLVACDLIQILAEGSGGWWGWWEGLVSLIMIHAFVSQSSLQTKFNLYYRFDSWSHYQYITLSPGMGGGGDGNAFGSVCLFVCLFVCLSVRLRNSKTIATINLIFSS